MKHYLIIGNGIAAAGCIEGIRSVDPDGAVTVASKEPHEVYCRPLISYYLEGKAKLENLPYRSADFYGSMGAALLKGKSVQAIDPAAHTAALDDGSTLSYDRACFAAGSSPFVPPIPGLDKVKQKYTFMTLDDALALEQALRPDSRVLIIGAGLIGLKCAEGIRDRVAEITVCDLADRVLPSILDQTCAKMVQDHLEAQGLRFLLGDTSAALEENRAHMRSGKTVEFDVLVLAVGVRANTSLLRDAGGEVNRGVVTDEHMRSSLPDIYAAGDCTEGMDISLGQRRVLAILPNAYMQGFTAGVNMAGGDRVFDNAIPMNAIGFFGLHALSAGTAFAPGDGGECFEQRSERGLRRLFTKDGLLTGFMLIGDTARVGIYTALIRERTPLDSINFELLRTAATTAAFPAQQRAKKFGGAV
ncbi:MAG: NAD(P)/FAD-dependent oxidoreductase [Ruminococcaceae bacterium]|nr:NAD(P)/FAD-dependent oxidoreductase [Oscillospiraceae bacterium]